MASIDDDAFMHLPREKDCQTLWVKNLNTLYQVLDKRSTLSEIFENRLCHQNWACLIRTDSDTILYKRAEIFSPMFIIYKRMHVATTGQKRNKIYGI